MATAHITRARTRAFDLWRHQNGRCFYCHSRFLSSSDFTVDHILPQALGGNNHPSNLVACCWSCNQQFGDVGPKLKMLWMLKHRSVI